MNREIPKPGEARDYFKGNEWQLPTDIRIVDSAAEAFRKKLKEMIWKEEDINWLEATFREVLINAIVHGNLNISEKSEGENWQTAALKEQASSEIEAPVYVKLDLTPDKIVIVIRDEGGGFDWKKQLESVGENVTKTSGRGSAYMKMFFDSVTYNEAGNEVTLSKERDRMNELFLELGIDVENIHPNILRKLRLLNKETHTFRDEERAIHIAQALFRYYELNFPDQKFTDQEKKTVLVGTLFTDIGKTGPRNATPEQEKVILSIYNVENVFKPEETTLLQFMQKYFPKDAEHRLATIETIEKVSRNMTMREFYNLHPEWTLEIISGDGVPLEAVGAAAAHHALEGVNPQYIIDKDSRFTKYFGDNISFSRDDKLIIILDKYDAARRRGKMTHAQAIEFVRNKIKSNEQFSSDSEFEELLDNLDMMISTDEKIYEE